MKIGLGSVFDMGYLRFLIITFVFVACCAVLPLRVQADSFVDIFDKELPVFSGMPEGELQKKGRAYNKTPLADDALSYEIYLPQVWKESKSFGYTLSKDIFTEIGRYVGPVKFNKASSFIVIKALDIGLQASAKTMAAANFMSNGFTVMGAKDHARNDVETLHVEVEKGESYVVRSRFIINGGRLVVVSYYLPSTSWQDERDLQSRVIQSFHLLNKLEAKITEVQTYEFWDIASFQYPQGWTLETGEDQSFDHMNVFMLKYEGDRENGGSVVIDGRMTLDLISRYVEPELADSLASQIDVLVSQGIVIQKPEEKFEPIILPEIFKDVSVNVYEILDSYAPEQKMELWIVGGWALGYNYVATMITPSRVEDFQMWGENHEAFQYMLEHLKPAEEF